MHRDRGPLDSCATTAPLLLMTSGDPLGIMALASASLSQDHPRSWDPGALPAGVGSPKPPARSRGLPLSSQPDSQAQSWWGLPWLQHGELAPLGPWPGALGHPCALFGGKAWGLSTLLPAALKSDACLWFSHFLSLAHFLPLPARRAPRFHVQELRTLDPVDHEGFQKSVKPPPHFTDEDTSLGRPPAPSPESPWGPATELVSLTKSSELQRGHKG